MEHEINAMLHKPRRLKYECCTEFVCQLMITAAKHDSNEIPALCSVSQRHVCSALCCDISNRMQRKYFYSRHFLSRSLGIEQNLLVLCSTSVSNTSGHVFLQNRSLPAESISICYHRRFYCIVDCSKLELATYLLSRLLYALFLPLRVRYNVIILLTAEIPRSIPISVNDFLPKSFYLLNITIDTFHGEDYFQLVMISSTRT